MRSRWLPRVLVALTVLVCLGAVGYAGQILLARRCAVSALDGYVKNALENGRWTGQQYGLECIRGWRLTPPWGQWLGRQNPSLVWCPHRTVHELLTLMTGQALPNDPDAWEAWFQAHPDLAWDKEHKRLVDRP